MKKLFVILIAALFLFSCGGSKKDNKNEITDDTDSTAGMPDSDMTDTDIPENDNGPDTEPSDTDPDSDVP